MSQFPPRAPEQEPELGDVATWLNLSHELRTPANAILGHVELLLSGSAGPLSCEARAGLGDIQQAASTLTATISELVRLAGDIPASRVKNVSPKS